jgi:hypothetical protein
LVIVADRLPVRPGKEKVVASRYARDSTAPQSFPWVRKSDIASLRKTI